jgi:hypothetical protein
METTTKFQLKNLGGSRTEILESYEEYKQDGWVLNEYEPNEFEMVLFLTRKIELNEGDLIAIGQFMLVEWKCYDVLLNQIHYVVEIH